MVTNPNRPLGALNMNGLPNPNIEIPELDAILKRGAGLGAGASPMPPGTAPEEPIGQEPGPTPMLPGLTKGPNMPSPGMPPAGAGPNNGLSPELSIASKMGQPQQDPEAKAIKLVTSAVTSLNQLADILIGSDEANARTVRQMIRILGEILRNARHAQIQQGEPLPAL